MTNSIPRKLLHFSLLVIVSTTLLASCMSANAQGQSKTEKSKAIVSSQNKPLHVSPVSKKGSESSPASARARKKKLQRPDAKINLGKIKVYGSYKEPKVRFTPLLTNPTAPRKRLPSSQPLFKERIIDKSNKIEPKALTLP